MSTKQTEALKMALEALEFYDKQGIGRTPGDKAITAIREALAEQPALDEDQTHYKKVIDDVQALFEAKREQQEPGATGKQFLQVEELLKDMLDTLPYNSPDYWIGRIKEVLPLYKSPPASKPWVGLTDEEIDVLYAAHHNQYGECETPGFGYERAIEDKLLEKNI